MTEKALFFRRLQQVNLVLISTMGIELPKICPINIGLLINQLYYIARIKCSIMNNICLIIRREITSHGIPSPSTIMHWETESDPSKYRITTNTKQLNPLQQWISRFNNGYYDNIQCHSGDIRKRMIEFMIKKFQLQFQANGWSFRQLLKVYQPLCDRTNKDFLVFKGTDIF